LTVRGDRVSLQNLRAQAAAIAIRDTGENLQVCLIQRKDSRKWGIPKGIVDPGRTHPETALNEAWEEAGLKGRLLGEAIGTYEYRKWGTRFAVSVFIMEVLEQKDEWQEAGIRHRTWTSFDEAVSLLGNHPVRPLLNRARELLADRLG
jgi:phosphohistidine phosphatase